MVRTAALLEACSRAPPTQHSLRSKQAASPTGLLGHLPKLYIFYAATTSTSFSDWPNIAYYSYLLVG